LRHVTVSRMGDGFAVSVDGRLHQVDLARIDAHTMSLIVDSGVPARAQDRAAGSKDQPGISRSEPGPGLVYETTIGPELNGRLVVLVGSMPVSVRLSGRGGRRRVGVAAGSGPLRIAAPMPGKVVRVLVKVGDAVVARQPVVVVEAMKMENELRADRDGTVAHVHAREGMLVDAGALLIVIQ
jgi:biotin carboxyl carrier protein